MNVGAVVGISVALIVVLWFVIGMTCFYLKRTRQNKEWKSPNRCLDVEEHLLNQKKKTENFTIELSPEGYSVTRHHNHTKGNPDDDKKQVNQVFRDDTSRTFNSLEYKSPSKRSHHGCRRTVRRKAHHPHYRQHHHDSDACYPHRYTSKTNTSQHTRDMHTAIHNSHRKFSKSSQSVADELPKHAQRQLLHEDYLVPTDVTDFIVSSELTNVKKGLHKKINLSRRMSEKPRKYSSGIENLNQEPGSFKSYSFTQKRLSQEPSLQKGSRDNRKTDKQKSVKEIVEDIKNVSDTATENTQKIKLTNDHLNLVNANDLGDLYNSYCEAPNTVLHNFNTSGKNRRRNIDVRTIDEKNEQNSLGNSERGTNRTLSNRLLNRETVSDHHVLNHRKMEPSTGSKTLDKADENQTQTEIINRDRQTDSNDSSVITKELENDRFAFGQSLNHKNEPNTYFQNVSLLNKELKYFPVPPRPRGSGGIQTVCDADTKTPKLTTVTVGPLSVTSLDGQSQLTVRSLDVRPTLCTCTTPSTISSSKHSKDFIVLPETINSSPTQGPLFCSNVTDETKITSHAVSSVPLIKPAVLPKPPTRPKPNRSPKTNPMCIKRDISVSTPLTELQGTLPLAQSSTHSTPNLSTNSLFSASRPVRNGDLALKPLTFYGPPELHDQSTNIPVLVGKSLHTPGNTEINKGIKHSADNPVLLHSIDSEKYNSTNMKRSHVISSPTKTSRHVNFRSPVLCDYVTRSPTPIELSPPPSDSLPESSTETSGLSSSESRMETHSAKFEHNQRSETFYVSPRATSVTSPIPANVRHILEASTPIKKNNGPPSGTKAKSEPRLERFSTNHMYFRTQQTNPFLEVPYRVRSRLTSPVAAPECERTLANNNLETGTDKSLQPTLRRTIFPIQSSNPFLPIPYQVCSPCSSPTDQSENGKPVIPSFVETDKGTNMDYIPRPSNSHTQTTNPFLPLPYKKHSPLVSQVSPVEQLSSNARKPQVDKQVVHSPFTPLHLQAMTQSHPLYVNEDRDSVGSGPEMYDNTLSHNFPSSYTGSLLQPNCTNITISSTNPFLSSQSTVTYGQHKLFQSNQALKMSTPVFDNINIIKSMSCTRTVADHFVKNMCGSIVDGTESAAVTCASAYSHDSLGKLPSQSYEVDSVRSLNEFDPHGTSTPQHSTTDVEQRCEDTVPYPVKAPVLYKKDTESRLQNVSPEPMRYEQVKGPSSENVNNTSNNRSTFHENVVDSFSVVTTIDMDINDYITGVSDWIDENNADSLLHYEEVNQISKSYPGDNMDFITCETDPKWAINHRQRLSVNIYQTDTRSLVWTSSCHPPFVTVDGDIGYYNKDTEEVNTISEDNSNDKSFENFASCKVDLLNDDEFNHDKLVSCEKYQANNIPENRTLDRNPTDDVEGDTNHCKAKSNLKTGHLNGIFKVESDDIESNHNEFCGRETKLNLDHSLHICQINSKSTCVVCMTADAENSETTLQDDQPRVIHMINSVNKGDDGNGIYRTDLDGNNTGKRDIALVRYLTHNASNDLISKCQSVGVDTLDHTDTNTVIQPVVLGINSETKFDIGINTNHSFCKKNLETNIKPSQDLSPHNDSDDGFRTLGEPNDVTSLRQNVVGFGDIDFSNAEKLSDNVNPVPECLPDGEISTDNSFCKMNLERKIKFCRELSLDKDVADIIIRRREERRQK